MSLLIKLQTPLKELTCIYFVFTNMKVIIELEAKKGETFCQC